MDTANKAVPRMPNMCAEVAAAAEEPQWLD